MSGMVETSKTDHPINEHDGIRRAHLMGGSPFNLPWASFADFFYSRVRDPRLATRTFLTYYDDQRGLYRRYQYAGFGRLVQWAAIVMHSQLGLRRGDRIATVLFNHDQTVLVYFAAWLLGVVVVPIDVEESPDKKQFILEHSEALVVFCWQDYLDEIRSIQTQLPGLRDVVGVGEDWQYGRLFADDVAAVESCAPLVDGSIAESDLSDDALIVYTSGTTGPPKGVILSAMNLLIDADGITHWHNFGTADRLMCVLPIHHVNGIVVTLITPFYFKGEAILNRKFKTEMFWRRIHQKQVTCVSVVPTLLEFLLEANEDITSYRLNKDRGMICGAGPLLKETASRFEDRFGFPIQHGYGLSETTCYSCFLPHDLSPNQHRRWLTNYEFPSIGVPIRHNEMTVLDDRGDEVSEKTHGEICIRGRTVCSGYFKRPDANEAAFRDGWFRSGDEGFFIRDDRGRPFFFISGRLKELIIRGGVNISPLEIDDVLKTHPSIQFAMAIPFENRFYGEEIAAYIVLRKGAEPPTESNLLDFCEGRLPFAKRPKVIVFGHDVPYTATGKPKRLELKTKLAHTLARYRDIQFKDARKSTR